MADRYDENLFLGFIEGDLTPAERLRFERQLAVDPNLRQLVEQVQLDRQELRQTPAEAAPPEIMDAVHQALERSMLFDERAPARSDQAARQQRLRLVRWSAYAAVAALALVSTGVVVQTLMQGPIPPGGAPPIAARIHTEAHEAPVGIDTVAMLRNNTGRAEVGSGGQFAVLVSDSAPNDTGRAASNIPAPAPAPGVATPALSSPMVDAKGAAPAGPAAQDGNAKLNGRLDQAKRGSELASANDALRDLKVTGGNDDRAKLAAQSLGSTTFVAGSVPYGLTGNFSSQRIEVVAQNTLRTHNNLVLWCTNNGSTLVADSAATLGNQAAWNGGNTLAINGGNFNSNSDGNFGWNAGGNASSNSISNYASPPPVRFQNDVQSNVQNNASGQRFFGNAQGNVQGNTIRLTVVVRPEKVSELVHFINAKGDVARLTDQDASGAAAPADGARAGGMAGGQSAAGARAEAASPASSAAVPFTTKLGKETEVAAAPGGGNEAILQRMRSAQLRDGLEERISKERRSTEDPAQVELKQAISRAQAAFPNERPAESGGGGEGGVAGTVSRGTPSGGSLARTNWALILQEQLPLSSALELPEAPASATTSLEVPVVITEEAAPEVK